MGRKKVTSSDVAAASGVSQATVSMILNRRENVSFSRETVEKVEAAAKELGYQIPRRKMRRESNGNKLIVVFCPTLTNPYYVMPTRQNGWPIRSQKQNPMSSTVSAARP